MNEKVQGEFTQYFPRNCERKIIRNFMAHNTKIRQTRGVMDYSKQTVGIFLMPYQIPRNSR